MKLKISDDLALPADAITQTFAVLAVRGAGKSNTAAAMAEEMFAARLPFVVVDPVGSWYGLRSSGDGSEPGLPILILGGRHGDVPLEKGSGAMVADMIVADRLSCVLDVSEFSEGEKIHFLIDFAERLYRTNRDPLHLFLEEADDYIPQRPMREQARLLRAFENIVRRGRARGLGITMITQRSAAINKNVLTQIETLIVLRTTSPQDRKAIAGWVEYHGQAHELLESLPSLEAGEAWVWSPSWLGIMERVRIRRRWTFDSGATPKNLKGTRPPATLADVDLATVKERMAATIERAKAEDPRELRKRIAELERELRKKPAAAAPTVDQAALDRAVAKAVREATAPLQAAVRERDRVLDRVRKLVIDAADLASVDLPPTGPAPAVVPLKPIHTVSAAKREAERIRAREGRRVVSAGEPSTLPVGEKRVLTAIAQYEDGVTRKQLTVLTGYKRSSRDTYIQRLRERGAVEASKDRVVVTDAGMEMLGSDFEPLPTGSALLEYWNDRLPEGERKVLGVLTAAYPRSVDRAELDEPTGYKRSSRDTYLQRLQGKRLITTERGSVRASDLLFD